MTYYQEPKRELSTGEILGIVGVSLLAVVAVIVGLIALASLAPKTVTASPKTTPGVKVSGNTISSSVFSEKIDTCTVDLNGFITFTDSLTNPDSVSHSYVLSGEVTNESGERVSDATGFSNNLSPGETELVTMIVGVAPEDSIGVSCSLSNIKGV